MHLEHALVTLRFDPALPGWLLGVIGAVCLAVLLLALWRRARGGLWRVAAFAVLLLWLAGPVLVQETRQGLPDIGLLVVDQSASMQVGGREKLADTARRKIEAEAGKLPDLQLHTVTVPEHGSEGTRLFAAIHKALTDIPRDRLAGIVAITDGEVTDVPKTAPTAPLNVLIPARGEQTDRRLRIIEAPAYGIVGHPVTLKVAIDDLGVAHPAPAAELTIRRDGEKPVVESVPIGVPHAIQVPITRAGPTVIGLSVAKLPGEVSTLNNQAVIQINGVRDRLRVLLVSGEPNPGERTWRRLLKSDPSVDLVHFTILRPPEKDDMTPLNELALIAFPVRELFQVKINQFDLIILDRFQNRGLLPAIYLQNIADYVQRGGALLLTVGPEYVGPTSLADTPLDEVLPAQPGDPSDSVTIGRFVPQVTALGTRFPVTEDLPGWHAKAPPSWGPWYRRIVPAAVTGDTLMQGPGGAPLLVLKRVGKGRVAMLLSDQIWLWSRGHDGGGPQAELLRRIAHWLMKEPDLEENALTARVADGKLLVERRSTNPTPPPPVTVTDPNGVTHTLMLTPAGPGRADAAMAATTPGVWRASDGTRNAYAGAESPDPPEIADLRATATKLGPLARRSGGGLHWLVPNGAPALHRTATDERASGAGWIGLRRNHAHLVTGIASLPLLPPWLALVLILGLAVIAWRREAA